MWVTNMNKYSLKGHVYTLANCFKKQHSHKQTKLAYLVTDMGQ